MKKHLIALMLLCLPTGGIAATNEVAPADWEQRTYGVPLASTVAPGAGPETRYFVPLERIFSLIQYADIPGLDDAIAAAVAGVVNGEDGFTSLVGLTVESPGANCATGGYRIDAGLDADGNGSLDGSEIDVTGYVCNGAQGPEGEQGLTGPAGADGPQGPQGLQGIQGEVGPQGPTGPEGPVGPAGADGLDGTSVVLKGSVATSANLPGGATAGDLYIALDTGDGWVSDGLEGWANIGPIQGPEGPQGPQGEAGPIGPEGPQGVQGEQGLTGAIGPAGPQGEQGLTGPQGPEGPQGPQGLQGEQGLTGPAGPAGADGAQGPQGDPGPAGADGAPGPNLVDASTPTPLTGLITGDGETIGFLPTSTFQPSSSLLTALAALSVTPGTSAMPFYNGADWTLSTELSISEIDLPTADGYKVGGVALDVGDLTDTGGVLGAVTANNVLTALIAAFPTMAFTISGCGTSPTVRGVAVQADHDAMVAAGVTTDKILWDYTGVCP